MVTDRVVLDQQLQDTIYQFEHKQGVVQKIDEDSRQLAEALENAVPIIITTLQKFPFVSRQLLKMAEERGEPAPDAADAALRGDRRRGAQFAVRRDGDRTQGSAGRRGPARRRRRKQAAEEGLRRHGRAVPQHGQARPAGEPELLRLHGDAEAQDAGGVRPRTDGKPASTSTRMRQAIEEGFILDVLKNYTTYKTYYRLLKAMRGRSRTSSARRRRKALARFMSLHPHNIAQKTEVMVEHFQPSRATRSAAGPRRWWSPARAWTRCATSRASTGTSRRRATPIKSLVAFSGTVEDDKLAGRDLHRSRMNDGIREKELPEKFATQEYQVLLVAEKYQTGFDQPLLHTMYVDKRLAGIQAVQTLRG